jgi:hypothetical protein
MLIHIRDRAVCTCRPQELVTFFTRTHPRCEIASHATLLPAIPRGAIFSSLSAAFSFRSSVVCHRLNRISLALGHLVPRIGPQPILEVWFMPFDYFYELLVCLFLGDRAPVLTVYVRVSRFVNTMADRFTIFAIRIRFATKTFNRFQFLDGFWRHAFGILLGSHRIPH